jgi:hypothetical protein
MSKVSHAALVVGVADADITPPVGAANRCWGAATHDVASGVHRNLKVCVWVINSEPAQVLVGMDGSWWQGARREFACRNAIAAAANTTPECVLLCLSHSHAAVPLVDDVTPGPGSALLEAYLSELPARLAEVTERAATQNQSSILQAVYGSCTLAACRDQRGEKGWIVGHDPDTQADQTLAVARLTHADGRLRAVLVNYACHPTSLGWENAMLSPDYVGALRAYIDEVYNVPLLFIQGAGGDLAPAWQYSGDTAVADRNGESLALSVHSALSLLPPPGTVLRSKGILTSGADLGCWSPADVALNTTCCIEVRPASLPWRADFESAAVLDAAIAAADGAALERLRRRKRLRHQFGDSDGLSINAWSARFGDILFFGTPGENYSQLQIDLRSRYPDNIVLVANHCNGGSGYLMPESLHQRDNFYPAWQSPMGAGSYERLENVFKDLGGDLLLR